MNRAFSTAPPPSLHSSNSASKGSGGGASLQSLAVKTGSHGQGMQVVSTSGSCHENTAGADGGCLHGFGLGALLIHDSGFVGNSAGRADIDTLQLGRHGSWALALQPCVHMTGQAAGSMPYTWLACGCQQLMCVLLALVNVTGTHWCHHLEWVAPVLGVWLAVLDVTGFWVGRLKHNTCWTSCTRTCRQNPERNTSESR